LGPEGAGWCYCETTACHQNVLVLWKVPVTGEEEKMASIFKKDNKEDPGKVETTQPLPLPSWGRSPRI